MTNGTNETNQTNHPADTTTPKPPEFKFNNASELINHIRGKGITYEAQLVTPAGIVSIPMRLLTRREYAILEEKYRPARPPVPADVPMTDDGTRYDTNSAQWKAFIETPAYKEWEKKFDAVAKDFAPELVKAATGLTTDQLEDLPPEIFNQIYQLALTNGLELQEKYRRTLNF